MAHLWIANTLGPKAELKKMAAHVRACPECNPTLYCQLALAIARAVLEVKQEVKHVS